MTYSLEPAGLRLRSIKWLLYQAAHTLIIIIMIIIIIIITLSSSC